MGERDNPGIEITDEMVERAAEELLDWVAFRTGYDQTMPIETARKEARTILVAALQGGTDKETL